MSHKVSVFTARERGRKSNPYNLFPAHLQKRETTGERGRKEAEGKEKRDIGSVNLSWC